MPPALPPQGGMSGFWNQLQQLVGRVTALETWQRTARYLQLPASAASPQLTWGIFTTGTGGVNNAGSGDWTLSGLSTGAATVNFPKRSTAPAVFVTVDTALAFNGWAQVGGLTPSSAEISTWNSAGPALINSIVSFAVIG